MTNINNDQIKVLEHVINELITLKLEDGRTNIYVNGEKVLHCKYLLLDISIDKMGEFDHFESIDQALDHFDHSLEPHKRPKNIPSLSPKEEFWGHCSNLQAWMENDYDMRIIDSRLGFTLLKKMKEAGHPSIDRKYREEIIKKLKSGWLPTIENISSRNYLHDFTGEEKEVLMREIKKVVKAKFMNHEPSELKELLYASELRMLLRQGYIYFLDDEDKRKIPIIQSLREECLNIIWEKREFRSIGEAIAFRIFEVSPKERNILYERYKEEYYGSDNNPRGKRPLSEIMTHVVLMGYFGALTTDDIINNYDLQELETLELSHFDSPYSLKVFPEGIVHLKGLKHLEVSKYKFSHVPEAITQLTNLRTLDLSENHLKHLPKSIGNLKNLEVLKLQKNQLESLPESIEQLPKLKELNIRANKFEKFPSQITHLTELRKLNLTSNRIETLPEELSKLASLESLEASNIKLKEVPASLGKLHKIKDLDLSYNELNKFPKEICSLTTLQKINLKKNSIVSIPDCIGNLKDITILLLAWNKIRELPDNIDNLQSLMKLDISSKDIIALPQSFKNLENLKWIKIWKPEKKRTITYHKYKVRELNANSVVDTLIRDGVLFK